VDDLITDVIHDVHVYQRFRCCLFPGREEIVRLNVFTNGNTDYIGHVLELVCLQGSEKLFRMKVFRLENDILEGNLSRHQIVRRTEQEVVRRSCDGKRKIILL